jgi:hypothetical protein
VVYDGRRYDRCVNVIIRAAKTVCADIEVSKRNSGVPFGLVNGLKPKSTFHDDTPFDSDLHIGAGQVVKLVPMGGDTTSPTIGVLAGGNGAPTGSKIVIFISATDEDTWSISYVIDATGCVAWRASVLDSGTGTCVVDGRSPGREPG